MLNFTKKLPKWTAVSLGDNNYKLEGGGGRGGSKSSSTELLTLENEYTQERSNSLSSVWKPVWYTGWHTGVLACATSVVIVLLINVSLTIYVATKPEYKLEDGVGTLYSGSCDTSRTIGMWLHLGINALSTLLLSGSNYTQQCLAAPTRSEIDAAHARRRWVDIGVPSVRNLFRIKPERALLWIAIGFTSIPLHLLYNSAVYTSIAANGFVATVVKNDFFEPGAYSNMTQALHRDVTDRIDSKHLQLFKDVLDGYNASSQNYEDLTPSECTKLYNNDFISDHRNLILITKHSSNATHNNTYLDAIAVSGQGNSPSSWMCAHGIQVTHDYERTSFICDPNKVTLNVTKGLPWRIWLTTLEVVEISGCKSEKTAEKCKVQFSLGIMLVVIFCNLVKACSMIMTVVRSREPTLVTLGDAVDSFLRIPDPTTLGICFADRRFVKREWRRGWRTGPRQWKQMGVQRWWTSASKTRWITCNFLCSITIIVAGCLLRSGMDLDGVYWSTDLKSMWERGFGKVNSVSLIVITFRNITQAILLANLPQTILSFLYLTYNSLFTCMLSGHEWSLFSHHHRTLRVTSPRPGQRSTYWLQIPYAYAIPLITLSGLLHWLTSQSIFLAKIEISDPLGKEISAIKSAVGYSCIAIIFVLSLGVLALVTAAGMGFRPFAAEITTVGSCSAAISAACHAWGEDSEVIIGKKVRWGDVGIVPNMGVRHFTFSSEDNVGKPIFKEVYAGTGREGE
ncbi:hypothetical protein L873DRAFT_1753827 [Choiromyces venosus 120613-1]|uniref:DUF6536 domain-containing protein n=1 Tax=Choiromyces venosus 120613-1 TaxID=1336337 RepID=A0A3N4J1S7_9PEZI|nr:hypothetical protein L873DRAFT_1753827 [Choiromyces venosus 120613-1]